MKRFVLYLVTFRWLLDGFDWLLKKGDDLEFRLNSQYGKERVDDIFLKVFVGVILIGFGTFLAIKLEPQSTFETVVVSSMLIFGSSWLSVFAAVFSWHAALKRGEEAFRFQWWILVLMFCGLTVFVLLSGYSSSIRTAGIIFACGCMAVVTSYFPEMCRFLLIFSILIVRFFSQGLCPCWSSLHQGINRFGRRVVDFKFIK